MLFAAASCYMPQLSICHKVGDNSIIARKHIALRGTSYQQLFWCFNSRPPDRTTRQKKARGKPLAAGGIFRTFL